jgi:hypothetical protein
MPRFYFHRHFNGQLAEDRRGRQFGSIEEACEHVVHGTPRALRKTIRSRGDTYLTTEVSDGERTVAVIRTKVLIEKR